MRSIKSSCLQYLPNRGKSLFGTLFASVLLTLVSCSTPHAEDTHTTLATPSKSKVISFLRTGPWSPQIKPYALDCSAQLKESLLSGNLRQSLNLVQHESSEDALLIKIDLLYQLGRWQEALSLLENATSDSPSLDIYRFILLDAAGRHQEALNLSTQLKVNDNHLQAFETWRQALQKLTQLSENLDTQSTGLVTLKTKPASSAKRALSPLKNTLHNFILKSADFCQLNDVPHINFIASSDMQDFEHIIWKHNNNNKLDRLFGTVDISRVWLYLPSGKAPAKDSLSSLLYHEAAHIISWRLSGINPNATWWVSEGFAEYLALKGLGHKLALRSTKKDLVNLLSAGNKPHPFCQNDQGLQSQYRHALDLFLVLEQNFGSKKIIRFMHFFSQGLNTKQAFKASFGQSIEAFSKCLAN